MKRFFNKLYKDNMENFLKILKENLIKEKRTFIVTANPEAFMFGEKDKNVESLLLDDDTTVVADGIGIVKAAKILNINIPERIPGVDIAEQLMIMGNELSKSIFILGSKQEVLDEMCKVLNEKYPNLKIAGTINGYVDDKDAVFDQIKTLSPDIVLVALGIPAQEKLIYKHLKDFNKGIFVGVGGSIDVLSGTKQRAPKFFINNNLEWLYRIIKEPSRIKRFYNSNVKFLFKAYKYK